MTMPKLRGRAEAVLTEAIRDSPQDPGLHVLLGRLHACAATAPPPSASFRKALELAPGHAEAQAELGTPAPPRRRRRAACAGG